MFTCHCRLRYYCHCFIAGSTAGSPSHLHSGSLASSEYRVRTCFKKSKWFFCVSKNANFKFCFIVPIPPYLKEFGHLLHIIFTFVLIFSTTTSDNSDEKKHKCICLIEMHTHTHTSIGGSEMFAEKLRMILCHLYNTFFTKPENTGLILRAHFNLAVSLSLMKRLQNPSFCLLTRSADRKHSVKSRRVNSRGHQSQI